MSLSNHAQAVLLLTAHLTRPGKGEAKPLSPREWGRFALWLKDHALKPESMLGDDPARLLAGWLDKTVTVSRIEALLRQGGALGLALEKWERAGLWIMTRSDPEYPERLKRRLRVDSPPILFGCGNRRLLGSGGLAVVGSRDAADADLLFAATLGAEASLEGMSIVSGGARGIDEAAMLGALEHDGTVVGVVADSLLRAATSAKYRKHLMRNNLVLVSSFNPEAGFDVGNAMARNRYIYCLADAAVVVSSSLNIGGTWTGAVENLKEGWVPLWVKQSSQQASGNTELVRRGARWLEDSQHDLSALILLGESTTSRLSSPQLPLLDVSGSETAQADDLRGVIPSVADREQALGPPPESAGECQPLQPEISGQTLGFYELFLVRVQNVLATSPLTLEQLRGCLDLTKPQLGAWLKRAVSEGQIKRLSKPVRYRWQGTPLRQSTMFGRDEVQQRRKIEGATK
jgi:predicted Rossmann fold nucleotide-binding protein DprA/Smf involved in DNA uptake